MSKEVSHRYSKAITHLEYLCSLNRGHEIEDLDHLKCPNCYEPHSKAPWELGEILDQPVSRNPSHKYPQCNNPLPSWHDPKMDEMNRLGPYELTATDIAIHNAISFAITLAKVFMIWLLVVLAGIISLTIALAKVFTRWLLVFLAENISLAGTISLAITLAKVFMIWLPVFLASLIPLAITLAKVFTIWFLSLLAGTIPLAITLAKAFMIWLPVILASTIPFAITLAKVFTKWLLVLLAGTIPLAITLIKVFTIWLLVVLAGIWNNLPFSPVSPKLSTGT